MKKSDWDFIKSYLNIQDIFLKKANKSKKISDKDKEILKMFCECSKTNYVADGIINFFDTLKILVDNGYLEVKYGEF